MTEKKFRFEDLQPHVDMLCDALENKGSSSSGIPYYKNVYFYAGKYRELLEKIRNNTISQNEITNELKSLSDSCLESANNNQVYRIRKILAALDFFIQKEYEKYC